MTTAPWPSQPHAVSRLRAERLARSVKPFMARGGIKGERCSGCRLVPSHCICALRPNLPTRSGMCLLMADTEPLKPSNTGWLIADVVPDTFAFGWARTEVDPALLALLADPQWQPYVVFPGEFVAPERVVHAVPALLAALPAVQRPLPAALPVVQRPLPAALPVVQRPLPAALPVVQHPLPAALPAGQRPLFILLDATWPEARKMFRKSPYLNHLPVLSLAPEQVSRYQLRRSQRDDHFCTSEVASLCLALAGEPHAASALQAYLDVYTHHYLQAKHQRPPDLQGPAHARWRSCQEAAK